MMKAEVRTPQHDWLKALEGDWLCASEAVDGAPLPPCASGRETVRALGDLWVLLEGRSELEGGVVMHTLMTLGFDPARGDSGRFVGSWVGSVMSMQWVYDGELDAAGRVLSLYCEGPDFSGSGSARYCDRIELISPDERTLTAHVQAPDGSWRPFMRQRFRRQAAG